MDIYEWLFTFFVLSMIGVTLYRVYNLMRGGKLYDLPVGFILFAGVALVWFIGLVVVLTNPETILYIALFRLGTGFLVFNALFLFAEVFFALRDKATKTIEAYHASDYNKGRSL
jgi:hypothetical protein